MTPTDFVRAAIPGASEALVDHVFWGRTSFPFGYDDDPARVIYKAAARFRRASERGVQLCDFCDRLAVKRDLCESCHSALRRVA